jgi:hypothetical protein
MSSLETRGARLQEEAKNRIKVRRVNNFIGLGDISVGMSNFNPLN